MRIGSYDDGGPLLARLHDEVMPGMAARLRLDDPLPFVQQVAQWEVIMTGAPTRYISSFIVEIFAEFMCVAVEKLQLSPDEVAILCLVASESTREIRKDPFARKNFGAEEFAFPDTDRPVVSIKFIHTRLGLSRETTRRKVAGLVEQGFLKRAKGGVFFPAQIGEDDYTEELRRFFVRKLQVLAEYRDRMPD